MSLSLSPTAASANHHSTPPSPSLSSSASGASGLGLGSAGPLDIDRIVAELEQLRAEVPRLGAIATRSAAALLDAQRTGDKATAELAKV